MEIKKIFKLSMPYKRWLIGAIILSIFGVSAAMVPPFLVRSIIDDVFVPAVESGQVGERSSLLLNLVLGLLGFAVARSVSLYGRNLCLENYSQRTLRRLKQRVYDHIQTMSFTFFNRNRTGELMARMTGDMEAIRALLMLGVMHGVAGVLFVILSASILFSLNWQLALIAMAATPFLALTTVRFRRTIHPRMQEIRKKYSSLNATVQESISGIRLVKSFMRYDRELEKFRKENLGLNDSRNKAMRVWAAYMPLIRALSGISTAFMLLFGGWMVIRGTISLGLWTQFNGYLWMLIWPMQMTGEIVNQIAFADASAERIFSILETDTDIRNRQGTVVQPDIRGEVEFRNVSWAADGQQILKNASFHVHPGQTIGIMGATGSGKSSLVSLINRFYDPSDGIVLVDGVDVREMDLKTLRAGVALVAQEPFLFSESMYNNLAFGRAEAPREFVRWVAQQTQAHEFIMNMNGGYDAIVGERGVGLSGGQKQRASIARALIKEAPILILDDSTSSVDMETETLIQEALVKMSREVTTFIIAHRISSVKEADQIIVLHDGEIVERGTHQQLLDKRGEYRKIFDTQYQDISEIKIEASHGS